MMFSGLPLEGNGYLVLKWKHWKSWRSAASATPTQLQLSFVQLLNIYKQTKTLNNMLEQK